MDTVWQGLELEWTRFVRWSPKIILSLVLLLGFVVLGMLIRSAVDRALRRSELGPTHRALAGRLAFWLTFMVGLSMAMAAAGLGAAATGILTGGGVTAVVLGFAFREIGENILAGVFLAFHRPFRIGDVVQSGEHRGRVQAIELRYTHIRAADGRDIYVPSAIILKEVLVNFTRDGLRRFSMRVGIDYRDDAASICPKLVATMKSCEGVLETPPPAAGIGALDDNHVSLEVSWWIDMLEQGDLFPGVQTRVLDAVRRVILEAGYTPSSEITTAIVVAGSLETTNQ